MKKNIWKKRIKSACEAAGTYKPYFDIVIDELAGILERRDDAEAQYDLDPRPVIEYTNKAEATNIVKNPLLMLIDDMNKSSLQYWRDLGLTPAGLRKINEQALKEQEEKKNSLLDKLAEMRKAKDNGRT